MLLRCASCKAYLIGQECPSCGGKRTISAQPPKFSVEDKYAKYRRMAKEQQSS